LPIELHTDASSVAIAAILLQKAESGGLAPIAYFSRVNNSAESKYHSFELEMLAVVKAIERFHIYLYGQEFTIITDCHALVHAVNKANINPRIARWILKLQNYHFKIVHHKGEKMAHVDALSRIVALVDSIPFEKELQFRQLVDPQIKLIAEFLEQSDHEKFEMMDGLVFRKCPDRLRFYVPEDMIIHILRVYHDDCAHCGFEKTVKGITDNYWFPSLRKKVQAYIDNCIICLTSNIGANVKEGEMVIGEAPKEPMHTIHMDHFGPLIESNNGCKHILVVVDAFTRFTWLFAVKTTGSKETVACLNSIFNHFSSPSVIISDRESSFTSSEFAKFVEEKRIYHRLIAVAAPWSNGLVERINRFLKSSLKKIISENDFWSEKLPELQYIINNTHHTAIKSTPSMLMFGFEKRNHSDSKLLTYLNDLVKFAFSQPDREIVRDKNRDIAIETSNKLKEYNKAYYDKRHKKPSKYQEGNHVLVRDTALKPGEDRKFKTSYRGPYLVAKTLNNNRYVITDIPGHTITARPYNSILSPDRLKPFVRSVAS